MQTRRPEPLHELIDADLPAEEFERLARVDALLRKAGGHDGTRQRIEEEHMTLEPTNAERELAHRAGDGIDVSLYWKEFTDRVTVRVYDARVDKAFEVEVEGSHALDAYRHPFAYAAAKQTPRTREP